MMTIDDLERFNTAYDNGFEDGKRETELAVMELIEEHIDDILKSTLSIDRVRVSEVLEILLDIKKRINGGARYETY